MAGELELTDSIPPGAHHPWRSSPTSRRKRRSNPRPPPPKRHGRRSLFSRIYLSEPHQVAKSKIPKGHRAKAGSEKSSHQHQQLLRCSKGGERYVR
ncbi:hypothetical protein NL676_005336 [Syzygium grande]|nr:hypothetical protein NL676_005336 [Syzygium grande]